MGRIAVLGEAPRVDVWALAGAVVVAASGEDAVRAAWESLPDDVEVVVASPAAADALGARAAERLVVLLP